MEELGVVGPSPNRGLISRGCLQLNFDGPQPQPLARRVGFNAWRNFPMKTILRSMFGFGFLACAVFASAALSPVPFAIKAQQFKAGDSIVIDQVLASAPQLTVGTQVTVRGHYQLASASKARLGLFVTHRSRSAGPDATAASQVQSIDIANGTFELSCEIQYEGDPHISFYPIADGEAFGGVYFSGPDPKS